MKKCPYCAEEIQDEAIVCRYCGRELTKPAKPAQPLQKPSAKKQASLLSIVGVLILLCCGLSMVRSFATNFPRVTPTAKTPAEEVNSSVVISTFTSAPTNTPKPTATERPRSTRTPRPTVDAYVLVAQEKFTDFMEAYSTVNKFAQQVAEDTTLIFDEDWKTNMGLALGVLNFRADELAKLEPTPAYKYFHSYLVAIARETHLFTTAYAKGIDNFDSESINTATVHLSNLTDLMENATSELESTNNP